MIDLIELDLRSEEKVSEQSDTLSLAFPHAEHDLW